MQALGDLAANLPDARQIGAAVISLGSSYGDEHDLGLGDALGQVGRERQATVALVAMHQLAEARFVNRHFALFQPLDLGRNFVNANDIVAAFGQARSLNQAHVSRSDH